MASSHIIFVSLFAAIIISLDLAACRGVGSGGRGVGGGRGGGYSGSGTTGEFSIWRLLFSAVVTLFGLLAFVTCLEKCCGSGNRVQCYVCKCHPDVLVEDWDVHRKSLCTRKRKRLQGLPIAPGVECGVCHGGLKMMPSDDDAPFECDRGLKCLTYKKSGMGAGGKREISNLGDNRFNCFDCDFDLCGKCLGAIQDGVVKIDPPFALMTKEEGQPPCQGKEGLSDKVKKPPATYGSTSR